jgi:FMN phosphatase YigB (HAD superfamily)
MAASKHQTLWRIMRISFDLDDTLICYDPAVPRERNRMPFWCRAWFSEPMRAGTIELMQELSQRGHELWIYTTSYREPKTLKRWFRFHGVRIERVVNQTVHEKIVRRDRTPFFVSKFPPAFEIDLHIDDQDDLREAGERLGFRVLTIRLDDAQWTKAVLKLVDELEAAQRDEAAQTR